jgi:hypothetical protein
MRTLFVSTNFFSLSNRSAKLATVQEEAGQILWVYSVSSSCRTSGDHRTLEGHATVEEVRCMQTDSGCKHHIRI